MKIALLGYGKMGKEIEKIALSKNHTISFIADLANKDYSFTELKNADVAIEFSQPDAVLSNIDKCFQANLPVVVGTTGWYNEFEKIQERCLSQNQTLFYATNFSVGVNIFFEVNKQLAKLMNPHAEYEVDMEEIHHIHKLDSPSGTGITLANGIIENLDRKTAWTENEHATADEVKINAKRMGEVPGTHTVNYSSSIDKITITHEAKNRIGFASGAVLASEWLVGKKGVFTMKHLLNF